jgi:solute:Na+ symporter, SSS family
LNWVLFSLLSYVALQLALGFFIARNVKSESDYLVAGRSVGLPLSVFTVFATWFGAETCIGATAQSYRSGISGVTADPFGYAVCLLFMGALLAVPLWRRKLTTLADLFRERFGKGAERAVVLLLVPTSVMWAGAQIRAFGQVLGASSELALTTTITIAATVVIIYTALGGMLADAISDLVQGIVLLLGMVLLLVLMVQSGDVDAVLSMTSETLARESEATPLDRMEAWAVPIFGSVVAQELVGRVVSARTPSIARRGTLIAACLYLAVGLIPVTVGLVAARTAPNLLEPEQVLAL